MLIRVRYKDNSSGLVDDTALDSLIRSGKILEFRRSDGWVRIGRDPIRDQNNDRRRRGSIINTWV
jgi:hypothetical protein